MESYKYDLWGLAFVLSTAPWRSTPGASPHTPRSGPWGHGYSVDLVRDLQPMLRSRPEPSGLGATAHKPTSHQRQDWPLATGLPLVSLVGWVRPAVVVTRPLWAGLSLPHRVCSVPCGWGQPSQKG